MMLASVGGGFRFGSPAWLHGLWAAPAALLALWWAVSRAKRAAAVLAGAEMAPGLTRTVAIGRRVTRGVLAALALAAVAVALARPQHDPEPVTVERRGREVVFLIDVSRSMLARDLAPSRLERAKIWVRDLVEQLEGDRVGLVAFAGAASVSCPLTLDRDFFDIALDGLDPGSVPRGGTLIGDGIRKTLSVVFQVDPEEPEANVSAARDIIIITDGEDQESFPVQAADLAGRAGVRIIALGVGSDDGAAVPSGDEGGGSMEYEGRAVRSRLEAGTLEEIATATPGGAFFRVGTGEIDLAAVYGELARAEDGLVGEAERVRWQEAYWLPLSVALALAAVEGLLSERRRA